MDGPHREYNRAVQELWRKNKYNPSEMTTADALDFIEQVRASKDPRIATFVKMIRGKLRKYNVAQGDRRK